MSPIRLMSPLSLYFVFIVCGGLEVFAPWGGVVGAELVAEHGGLVDGALGVARVKVTLGPPDPARMGASGWRS